MTTLLRRPRDTSIPPEGRELVTIDDTDLDESDFACCEVLEASLNFKALTNPWLQFFEPPKGEHRRTKRRGHLRENGYIDVPPMWEASPNCNYKHLMYQLADDGVRVNKHRGVPMLKNTHRSNSYYHEAITDLCFAAPLRYLAKTDPNARLITPAAMLQHSEVPHTTRTNPDPFGIELSRNETIHLDYPAQVWVYNGKSIGIPGIQTDRTTEGEARNPKQPKRRHDEENVGRTTLGTHIKDLFTCMNRRVFEKQFSFDKFAIPILIVDRRYDRKGETTVRMERVMTWVKKEFGANPNLIFRQLPDVAMLKRFPLPSADFIKGPWKRVGYPDFDFQKIS